MRIGRMKFRRVQRKRIFKTKVLGMFISLFGALAIMFNRDIIASLDNRAVLAILIGTVGFIVANSIIADCGEEHKIAKRLNAVDISHAVSVLLIMFVSVS